MTKKDFAKALFEKGIFVSKAESERNFIGWGKFEVVQKAERMGRNPKTGEEIKIEAKKTVKFKAGKTLTDKMN